MEVIIHHNNFKPSKPLDEFIQEKSAKLSHINAHIIKAEYHLSVIKNEFKCTLQLSLKGKDINTTRTTEDMHYSILKVIEAAQKSLRKKKTIALNKRQKKARPGKE